MELARVKDQANVFVIQATLEMNAIAATKIILG